ncbi:MULTISPECIES: L-glyceraldehyde 3-phosphate reductase [unclassified Carboxylicivirga]|uniref:L-glyceraldehyde 3-phosphate reductase n=1 Tax=Carboxylicivirga TaxID=1628153 RepID=UPI003D344988
MNYLASEKRYETMTYQRCGRSGLQLPAISLGLWHNFGSEDVFSNAREILLYAFDRGVTHFDLANNYGPVPGSAEETLGRVLKQDWAAYRDELIISTKAGYTMWEGPYGDWGSKKYLVASLNQSLKRMGLDYVDIFYHHRPDPETPMEETMMALDQIVRQGKALYVGLSNYSAADTQKAESILRELGTPCLIHQPRYNLFDRWVEQGLTDVLDKRGIGCIAFSPLAQGLLSNRYLKNIPSDSRMAKAHFLKSSALTEAKRTALVGLNTIAQQRGQSLAQMAISWLLNNPTVTSVLVGASSAQQLGNSINALDNLSFSAEELKRIDNCCDPVVRG